MELDRLQRVLRDAVRQAAGHPDSERLTLRVSLEQLRLLASVVDSAWRREAGVNNSGYRRARN